MIPAKAAEPIAMPTRVGPRNHVLDRVQILIREYTILMTKRGQVGHARRSIYSNPFNRGCIGTVRCPLWCKLTIDEGAYWRNLANTIESSVCGGDAALCQNYSDQLLPAALREAQSAGI